MRNPLNVTQIQLHQLGTSAMAPAQTDTLIGVHAGQTSLQYPLSQIAQAVRDAGNANVVTPQQFGPAGDGVADDTAAFNRFLANVSGKVGELYGTYKLTSLPTVTALSNCALIGVPGNATITGAFGYTMLQFGALNNVLFENIKFNNTYSNASFNGVGTVYVFEQDMKNVAFLNCEFTNPSANSVGLALAARFTGTTAVAQGIWIEGCNFHDIGQAGCLIMNRAVVSDKYTAASQIYFNQNRSANLGLLDPFGVLVSLDGYGSGFTVNNNLCNGCTFEGIENTGFINGSIIGNSSTDGSIVVTLDGSQATPLSNRVMTGLTVMNNVMYAPYTGNSLTANFSFVTDSYFAGNVYRIGGTAQQCMLMRGVQNCTFIGEQYISTSGSALFAALIETPGSGLPSGSLPCYNNSFKACVFDNSASAANNTTVLFGGSGTTNNVLDADCFIFVGSNGGAAFGNTNSAVHNLIDHINIRMFGAAGDADKDDTSAIITAVTTCSNMAFGTLYAPAGNYRISNKITLPTNVRIVGDGMLVTIFTALNTFPAATPMFQFGAGPFPDIVFHCGLSDLRVHCFQVAAIGVYSNVANEGCGLDRVQVSDATSIGIFYDDACEHFGNDTVGVDITNTTASYGIKINHGPITFTNLSVTGRGAGQTTACVFLDVPTAGSPVGGFVYGMQWHLESATSGLLVSNGTTNAGAVMGIDNSSCTQTVLITTASPITLINAAAYFGGTVLVDNASGITLAPSNGIVPYWSRAGWSVGNGTNQARLLLGSGTYIDVGITNGASVTIGGDKHLQVAPIASTTLALLQQFILGDYASDTAAPLALGNGPYTDFWGLGPSTTSNDKTIRLGGAANPNTAWDTAADGQFNLELGGSLKFASTPGTGAAGAIAFGTSLTFTRNGTLVFDCASTNGAFWTVSDKSFQVGSGPGTLASIPQLLVQYANNTAGPSILVNGPYTDFIGIGPATTGNDQTVRIGGATNINTAWDTGATGKFVLNYGGAQLDSYTFTQLPSSPIRGQIFTISDGLAGNCADGTCTTFGTNVTGGGGALKLLVWYNGTNWTLMGK